MDILVCSEGYRFDYNKNKIYIHNYAGSGKDYLLKKDERIDNLNITIRGENNEIHLEEPISFNECAILIEGNNNKVVMARTRYKQKFTLILPNNAGKMCNGRYCSFGKDVYLGKLYANCGNDNHRIIVGDDCLLAEGVVLRTVDGHTIYDNASKKILNRDKGDIVISSHVWIGGDVKVLKGTEVAKHCVVAMGSILTKKYEEERCVIGGSPAKVLKRGINWSSMNTEGFLERIENPDIYIAFHNRLNQDCEI